MTNLERRVAEAYENARNPLIVVKAKRNALDRSTTFNMTDHQLAQMNLIGGHASMNIAKAVEREFLRGRKR